VRVPQLELPVTIRFMVGITPAAQLPVAAPLLEKVQFKATDAPTGELMEFFLNPVTVGSIQ